METADGTKVGRDWKVVKSEYVSWQEAIARKQHDLHDEHKLNQPAGSFTECSMQRSYQSWVKTYMEDITDSNRKSFVWQLVMVHQEVVFCNDKCLGMRAYVEHRRVDTQT